MSKLRYALLAVACAGALAAVAALAFGHERGERRRSRPRLQGRPSHVGRRQGEEHRADDHHAGRFRHASHVVDADRSEPGIGAATTWVYNQLQAYAAASGGRMTVEKQTFTQPAGNRIPVPTEITNVIATLHG